MLSQYILASIPIAFYSQENSGPAKARNYGVEMAKGDYIAFTDDDLRTPSGS